MQGTSLDLKVCEICGAPATSEICDAIRDESNGVYVRWIAAKQHAFCDEHYRQPRTVGTIDRSYLFDNT